MATGVKKTELLRRAGQHAAGAFLKVCEKGRRFAAPSLCTVQRVQSPPSQNLTTPYNNRSSPAQNHPLLTPPRVRVPWRFGC